MADDPSIEQGEREPRRRGWLAGVAASALVVLARPDLIVIALGGFLARGGIVLVAFPIIVLPTPAGLANVFAPFVVQVYFGSVSIAALLLGAAVFLGLLIWLFAGGLVGAACDVALIGAVAREEELLGTTSIDRDRAASGSRTIIKASVVRLVAHVPVFVVIALSALRIYQATYSELTSPFEVVTPLIVRILTDVPDAIAALVLTWILGEAAGGLAVRYLVLSGRSTAGALARGWWHLIRHPISSLGTLVAMDAVVLAAAVAAYATATVGWGLVEATTLGPGDSLLAIGAVVALIAAWLAGLVVIGIVVAWRGVAWTAEFLRLTRSMDRQPATPAVEGVGTIGGSDDARPGDWSSADPSGTV